MNTTDLLGGDVRYRNSPSANCVWGSVQVDLSLEEKTRSDAGFTGIVGQSPVIRKVLQQVEMVATGNFTVLLLGETGTGKELIARAIHNYSPRRKQPFVKLNCVAIAGGLFESELLGHERGAFTDAIAHKIGRVELAEEGSLFLDEVGEIPLPVQPKLLRVLQDQEFERLGSTLTKRVDVRFVAATHRDLKTMVQEERFRRDLYYRLNVFPISIPPLRERRDDIPLLVQHFVQEATRSMNKRIDLIPQETMETFTQYRWPGNIRELQNVIERAVILSRGSVLRVPRREFSHNATVDQTLADAEREHILTALKETDGIVAGRRGAAARLQMKPSTLRFRMKKLGIDRFWP